MYYGCSESACFPCSFVGVFFLFLFRVKLAAPPSCPDHVLFFVLINPRYMMIVIDVCY
jgi:hypothetical protein